MRLGFDGMNQVRKLHRVLDEEHRHIVADQIPIALIGVKLDGKATYIARRILGSALTCDGRESYKHRRNFARFLKRGRAGDFAHRLIRFKKTVRARSTRVNNALRNALMVKVGKLFAEYKIFEQSRATQTRLERILIIGYGHALIGRHNLTSRIDPHPVQRADGRIDPRSRCSAGFVRLANFAQGTPGSHA